MSERIREHRSDVPSAEEVASRSDDGWGLAAVEWERAGDVPGSPGSVSIQHETPYGLRSSGEGRFLEEDESEQSVLRRVLSGLVDDRPLSEIATELNEQGLRMRNGQAWKQTALFDLLPRIVEAGAEILRSEAWSRERQDRRLRAV